MTRSFMLAAIAIALTSCRTTPTKNELDRDAEIAKQHERYEQSALIAEMLRDPIIQKAIKEARDDGRD